MPNFAPRRTMLGCTLKSHFVSSPSSFSFSPSQSIARPRFLRQTHASSDVIFTQLQSAGARRSTASDSCWDLPHSSSNRLSHSSFSNAPSMSLPATQVEPLHCVDNLVSLGCWQTLLKRPFFFSQVACARTAPEPLSSVKNGRLSLWSSMVKRAAFHSCAHHENRSASLAEESEEALLTAECLLHQAEKDEAQSITTSRDSISILSAQKELHESNVRTSQKEANGETTVQEADNVPSVSGAFSGSGDNSNGLGDSSNVEVPDDATLDKEDEAEPLEGRSAKKSSSDGVVSRVRSQAERRRRGGLFARNTQGEIPDLLTVPGIGPRNLEKLVAKGIGKVAELKQLYRDKFLNDESTKMVEYLQSSVGIVHKNHAESITSYVKHSVDEELKAELDLDRESSARQKKRVTICVEGNISVGKTTFLQRVANEIIELRDLVEIVPEPVGKWKDVGPDHFNLLNAFYNEPERYAYTFQNYVFATRLMQEQESSKGLKPLRLMERSIFSDRLVFVRAVHEAKWMSELELRIYESWFDPFISALPGLVPDGFIYLRASPDTCLQRLHMRDRPEERAVTLEYLRGLHDKHEQCFFPAENNCGGVLSVSQWPIGPHKPPPSRIRDRVFYLEGDHLHSSIRRVPALVLDCEPTIDFNRDIEARAEYAQQVAEFCEYVRSAKDFETKEKAVDSMVNPLMLPHTGGLLRPDGSILHSHALNSIDFTRHSSAFAR